MNDFSDLLYTIMSIVIFSFLLLQANSLILRNETVTVDHEFEKTAIAAAQSIIDEAKTRAFDWAILDGTDPSSFPEEFVGFDGRESVRENFAAFDDYHLFNETPLIIPTELGDYEVTITVEYVDVEDIGGVTVVSLPSEPTTFNKRMTVRATSVANNESATLVYVKSYVPDL